MDATDAPRGLTTLDRQRVVRHACLLAVVLVALLPVIDAAGPAWVDDDALYGLQVRALEDGEWEGHVASESTWSVGVT